MQDVAYRRRITELLALLHGRRPALVDIISEIREVHPALRLLTGLDAHDWQRNVAAERLTQQLLHRQMAEKVAAYPVERHHGLPVVLRH